jgi:MATE family multidrug resistance protein
MMSFTGILARTLEGSTAVAALSIGIRAEAIAYMPGFGYSVAASALVGQCLGARDPRRAERCAWASTFQGMLVMAIVGVGFYLFSAPLAGLFTNDPSVRQLGADYLRINSVCEPFMALGMVLTGAL